jgi:hypothetical protein
MPAMILAVLLYLTLMVACGHYTARYAAQRGRSKVAWFIWGALLFPLPYLPLALLRPLINDSGSPTPPTATRGATGGLPTSQAETPPKSRNETGHPRGGLVAVRV